MHEQANKIEKLRVVIYLWGILTQLFLLVSLRTASVYFLFFCLAEADLNVLKIDLTEEVLFKKIKGCLG